MSLKFEKEDSDSRGKFIFCSYGDMKISLFEIKKGQARGGFSWKKEIQQSLISGKVEYRITDVATNQEKVTVMTPPSGVILLPGWSDLILAIEDSLMIEIHNNEGEGLLFEKYRKIVEEKLNQIK